ncbi:hypothetical protein O1L60_36505 [Streptomyces diastatochromogenes]|nr:hypothetical protein [Streptomyces diastatochromogenes]
MTRERGVAFDHEEGYRGSSAWRLRCAGPAGPSRRSR